MHVIGHHVNFSLIGTYFSNNSAISCGTLKVGDSNIKLNFVNSSFIDNRESMMIKELKIAAKTPAQFGGVACITNSEISIINSEFISNQAMGHGCVFYVENSSLFIRGSDFSKNRAQRNGGVIFTMLSSVAINIYQSSFTYNQAGGDGGVMYIKSLGKRGSSQLTIRESRFSFNNATRRGGMIAVIGGQVDISEETLINNNTAATGDIISTSISEIHIQNELVITDDPINPQLCTFYDTNERRKTTTISHTTSTSSNIPTINAALSFSIVIFVLMLLLYTIAICIILYTCVAY